MQLAFLLLVPLWLPPPTHWHKDHESHGAQAPEGLDPVPAPLPPSCENLGDSLNLSEPLSTHWENSVSTSQGPG